MPSDAATVRRLLALPRSQPATLGNLSAANGECLSEVDDGRLLDRARRGDAEAFSSLFDRHQRAVYRYAVHMCGRESGDDVVQETFMAILRGRGEFDPSRGTVTGYLFGIARHMVLKRLSPQDRLTDPLDEGVTGAQPSDDLSALDHLTRRELTEAIRAAIGSLPAVYREAVVLCELEEMGYADAAAVVRCPIGTIRSRLHRARALLAGKLAAMRPVVGSGRS